MSSLAHDQNASNSLPPRKPEGRNPDRRAAGRWLISGLAKGLAGAALLSFLPGGEALAALNGGQLSWRRWQQGGQDIFAYRLENRDGRQFDLRFGLSSQDVRTLGNSLRSFDDPAMRQQLQQELDRKAKGLHQQLLAEIRSLLEQEKSRMPRGVTMTINRQPDGQHNFSLSSDSRYITQREMDRLVSAIGNRVKTRIKQREKEHEAALKTLASQRQDEILKSNYYVVVGHRAGKRLIRLDYTAVARMHVRPLAPLARALSGIAASQDPREKLAAALMFLQAIPYSRLEGRSEDGQIIAERTGFARPVEMLRINRGDCDSKSTALAALLPTLLPGHDAIMVTLPDHALLGVAIPARRGDRTYRYGNRTYVLMEPAGPGQFRIGEIFSDSDIALKNGRVREVIPMTV